MRAQYSEGEVISDGHIEVDDSGDGIHRAGVDCELQTHSHAVGGLYVGEVVASWEFQSVGD